MTPGQVAFNLTVLGVVVLVAVIIHVLLFRALFRFGWRTATAQRMRHRLKWPARSITALVALLLALPVTRLDEELVETARHVVLVAIIVAVAMLLIRGIRVVEENLVAEIDLEVRDNLTARRRLTQVLVLRRVATVAIAVLAGAAILLTFEEARSIGASVLASAGVVGILAGIAGRTTIGNMVAGLQIVLSEPIRLEDVVVVEDEWGYVEEVTLTYVVIRLWDRRRLVLPTSYFVEHPFENWTRERAQVIGEVSLYLDHRAPVEGLRVELDRVLRGSERWDGDVSVLQVIDTTEHTIHVRALMSAEDAPTAWDLRCEVREQLIRWLRENHPEGLPKQRILVVSDGEFAEPELTPPERGAEAHMLDAVGPGSPVESTEDSGETGSVPPDHGT